MKMISLAIALAFSTTALAGQYSLESVAHQDIDQYLTIASAATGTPENLQGLWWMDGNPLADEVVSFAGLDFEEIIEDGELVGYRTEIPVYDEGIWSWHDSVAGRLLYGLVLTQRLVYVGVFNPDFTYGEVTPTIRPLSFLPTVTIPRSMLVDFTMTQVTEDEWSRDSVILGQASSYRFRRIVDGSGKRLPAYDAYVQAIEERGPANALLPYCKKDNGTVLPTACAR